MDYKSNLILFNGTSMKAKLLLCWILTGECHCRLHFHLYFSLGLYIKLPYKLGYYRKWHYFKLLVNGA